MYFCFQAGYQVRVVSEDKYSERINSVGTENTLKQFFCEDLITFQE